MTRTTGEVGDTKSFDDALRLYPTIEAVAEHNVAKLRASGQPIAVLRAAHTGPGASKATSDDAGGLEPVICIAHGARVMLSANLWVEVGLVNGALGTVEAICYEGDQRPPNSDSQIRFLPWSHSARRHCSHHSTAPHLVFNHKAMLTSSDSTQARLGCHHSQGQGCH